MESNGPELRFHLMGANPILRVRCTINILILQRALIRASSLALLLSGRMGITFS